jgi:hypothetical protein
MFRRTIAAFLLAVPAAALAQTDEMGGFGLATMPNGCMVQAVSPQGTMISIWGMAGDDKLGILLQNREWSSLREGASYKLSIDFLGGSSLPVNATAREKIDEDGPGLYFTLEPGASTGKGFIEAFSSAKGMRITQQGKSFDTMPLSGGRGAMGALARCLADRWANGVPVEATGEEEEAAEKANVTI